MAEPWMTAEEMRSYADTMIKNHGISEEIVLAQLADMNGCDLGPVKKILNAESPVMEYDLIDKPDTAPEGFTPITVFNKKTQMLEERMALYEKGMTDREIAQKQGVGDAAVWKWRKKLGLPANKSAVSGHARRRETMEAKRVHKKDEERVALYRDGLKDEEIAEKQGVKPVAVTFWREKNGLPPNEKKKPQEDSSPDAEELESSGGALESSGTLVTEEIGENADECAISGLDSTAEEFDSTVEKHVDLAMETDVRDNGFTPLGKHKPAFMLEKPKRMNVAVLAELLRKVAEGWPDAMIVTENANEIIAASLRIDYGTDGREERVAVCLFED